jgi:hypothetical protein
MKAKRRLKRPRSLSENINLFGHLVSLVEGANKIGPEDQYVFGRSTKGPKLILSHYI